MEWEWRVNSCFPRKIFFFKFLIKFLFGFSITDCCIVIFLKVTKDVTFIFLFSHFLFTGSCVHSFHLWNEKEEKKKNRNPSQQWEKMRECKKWEGKLLPHWWFRRPIYLLRMVNEMTLFLLIFFSDTSRGSKINESYESGRFDWQLWCMETLDLFLKYFSVFSLYIDIHPIHTGPSCTI